MFEIELFICLKMDLALITYNGWCTIKANQTLLEESLKFLLKIFNKIWTEGNSPDIWKQTTIVQIPKLKKDSRDLQNYRPISLTSCLYKTMERIINNRLIWHLESNNLIFNLLCGFRSKKRLNRPFKKKTLEKPSLKMNIL